MLFMAWGYAVSLVIGTSTHRRTTAPHFVSGFGCKYRCLSVRGAVAEVSAKMVLGGRNNCRKHNLILARRTSHPAEREVRNQRGFGGVLGTLPPRAKYPAPERGTSPPRSGQVTCSGTRNNSCHRVITPTRTKRKTAQRAAFPIRCCDIEFINTQQPIQTEGSDSSAGNSVPGTLRST